MFHRTLGSVQPDRITSQTIQAAECKGGFSVIVDRARLLLTGKVAVQYMMICTLVLIQHRKAPFSQSCTYILVAFILEHIYVFGQSHYRDAAAAQRGKFLLFIVFFLRVFDK